MTMTPEERDRLYAAAQNEQDSVAAGEVCAGLWWSIYKHCQVAGFNDEQSLRLVIAFIQTNTR